jgi:hypothetical protein
MSGCPFLHQEGAFGGQIGYKMWHGSPAMSQIRARRHPSSSGIRPKELPSYCLLSHGAKSRSTLNITDLNEFKIFKSINDLKLLGFSVSHLATLVLSIA